jgi:Predicted lactoylglutathione lyase
MALTSKQIYVNLHVKDVKRSMAFFTGLGFEFDLRFTDEKQAACLVIGENIYVMLLQEEYLKTFTKREVVDTEKYAQLTIALAADSREKVDEIVNKAVSLGGKLYTDPMDHGFMYQWGFQDPDGHVWEIGYMDMSVFEAQGQEQGQA